MPIHSEFAGQDDWTELLEEFVDGLTDRIGSIENALAGQDLESLKTIVHQLRGACGSYGFHAITPMATDLELLLTTSLNLSQCCPAVLSFVEALQAITLAVDPADGSASCSSTLYN